jgi:uncharacterized protein YjbI with pentapeptide repeats
VSVSDAWMPHTSLRHADFHDAHTAGAVIGNADLTGATRLDNDRYRSMIVNDQTIPLSVNLG